MEIVTVDGAGDGSGSGDGYGSGYGSGGWIKLSEIGES